MRENDGEKVPGLLFNQRIDVLRPSFSKNSQISISWNNMQKVSEKFWD